jgi:chorismate synthase
MLQLQAAKCSIMRYADTCTIEAGYDEGTQRTLGSPVMIRVPNKDQKSKDYAQVGC